MPTILYISGAQGKMGQAISSWVHTHGGFSIHKEIAAAEVIIDFSSPKALVPLLESCYLHCKPLIVGTTGYSLEQKSSLQHAAQQIPLLLSPNFSLGMNTLMALLPLLSQKLQGKYQVDISEIHHLHKKDRPSGTALALLKLLGEPTKQVHSLRLGETLGEHTLVFALEGEEIELKHRVQSRYSFVQGALLAANFLKNKKPGLYSMQEVLCDSLK